MSTVPTTVLETTVPLVTEALDPTAVTEAGLDIESLKEMMDAFDPAALLPDLSELFGSLASVCRVAVMIGPIVLLILGLCYLFLSPKEANYYFGYRTYFGMGSVNAWRFTQRIAGMLFGALGLVLTIVMLLVTGSFAAMEVEAMVWKAISCLVWEAVLAIVATLIVNGLAMYFFDRKGEYRRKPKAKKEKKEN